MKGLISKIYKLVAVASCFTDVLLTSLSQRRGFCYVVFNRP
jgi:hypothetical protein